MVVAWPAQAPGLLHQAEEPVQPGPAHEGGARRTRPDMKSSTPTPMAIPTSSCARLRAIQYSCLGAP